MIWGDTGFKYRSEVRSWRNGRTKGSVTHTRTSWGTGKMANEVTIENWVIHVAVEGSQLSFRVFFPMFDSTGKEVGTLTRSVEAFDPCYHDEWICSNQDHCFVPRLRTTELYLRNLSSFVWHTFAILGRFYFRLDQEREWIIFNGMQCSDNKAERVRKSMCYNHCKFRVIKIKIHWLCLVRQFPNPIDEALNIFTGLHCDDIEVTARFQFL